MLLPFTIVFKSSDYIQYRLCYVCGILRGKVITFSTGQRNLFVKVSLHHNSSHRPKVWTSETLPYDYLILLKLNSTLLLKYCWLR